MNPPAAWNPAATVPGGVQPARGAMDPRHAWLRGVRAPLVCMLVGAVVGVLYSPLAILIAAVTRNSTASGALVYGLVEGVAAVAAGLCTLMGIALLAPVAGDGRSGRGGVAMIAAFVLTAAYTGCMIARAEVRFRFLMSGNGRLVWNAIATVGGGLMSLVMIVLVMVMTRSGRPVPATGMAVPASAAQSMNMAKPYGSGARMVVLVACIVVVVCDLLVSVLYRGPLSTGGSVLESLYSAVNAIMFVLAVMLPLVALAGRLRETTGVNSRVAVLVVAVVCALAQVVSVCCTIGQLWLVGQSIEGKLSFDEYSDKYASLSFTNTVMSVVFYLTIVVAVVVMLVAVSKAARGVSGPARPVAYAPAPVAPVSMTPYASPAPQGGYNAPRNAPASQSGYGAGASDPSVPLPPAHSVQSPVAQTPQTRYPRR